MRRVAARTPKTGSRRCPSGKVRFRDRTSATTALGRAKSSTRERKPVRAYECTQCKGWHLTSQA